MIVIIGYGSNDNRLMVWGKVDWMVLHSDCKHLYQRLLHAVHQFSEPKK